MSSKTDTVEHAGPIVHTIFVRLEVGIVVMAEIVYERTKVVKISDGVEEESFVPGAFFFILF